MTLPESTNSYAQGQFRPHGWRGLERDGDIAIFRSEGPYNLEMVQALKAARQANEDKYGPGGRRATITVVRNSLMMSPEALAAFEEYVLSLTVSGVRGAPVAWVVPQDVEGRDFMLPYFERMYVRANRPWRAFEDVDTAMEWIRSLLDAKPAAADPAA